MSNLVSFPKGIKKGGRQKGTPNRTTAEIKQAFQQLVDDNLDNMNTWLEKVADKDPEKALRLLIDMSEFIVPKLSRSAVEVADNRDNEPKIQLFMDSKLISLK